MEDYMSSDKMLEPKRLTVENDPLHIIKTRLQTHGRPATISGPMVRYSKLPFRQLCHYYNTDITYTPMILAREFVRNRNARISDFTTNLADSPVVAQVGVNNTTDLLRVIEMICPFVDGISVNCGCPIKEQIREGIGCALIYNEDLMVDMVKTVRCKYGSRLRLEMKIRIHEHDKPLRTLKLCEMLCDAGVDWITVHGRLKSTRSSQPVDLNAIKYIVDGLKGKNVPIVANGDCFTVADMERIQSFTGCHGVMSARGLLSNPALFAGYNKCPWGCLERFVYYCVEIGGLPLQLMLHHVYCMMENMQVMRRYLKQIMSLSSIIDLILWLETNFEFSRYGEEGFGTRVDVPYRK